MYRMKATIRDLRYRFSKLEELLQSEEEIPITRRKRVVARVLPPLPTAGKTAHRLDFLARLKAIYGIQRLDVIGAELAWSERDRY